MFVKIKVTQQCCLVTSRCQTNQQCCLLVWNGLISQNLLTKFLALLPEILVRHLFLNFEKVIIANIKRVPVYGTAKIFSLIGSFDSLLVPSLSKPRSLEFGKVCNILFHPQLWLRAAVFHSHCVHTKKPPPLFSVSFDFMGGVSLMAFP